MSVKDDLTIDRFALDDAWVLQPTLFQVSADRASEDERDKDRAKANLELIEAELDTKIRKNPAQYGVDKPTEASVKATIPQQPEYKKALKEYIDARYVYDVSNNLVKALDHKKAALEYLVKLMIAGFYSKPTADKSTQEELRERSTERQMDVLNKDVVMEERKTRIRRAT